MLEWGQVVEGQGGAGDRTGAGPQHHPHAAQPWAQSLGGGRIAGDKTGAGRFTDGSAAAAWHLLLTRSCSQMLAPRPRILGRRSFGGCVGTSS